MIRRLTTMICFAAALVLASGPALAGVSSNCNGKFANPITDICWSCIFPISLGGTPIITAGQEDGDNPGGLLCACGPVLGIKIGFWEPVRRVDVTRVPYCFVSLGGIKIDPGIRTPEGEVRMQQDLTKQSSYQVHWYLDPILFWLEVLLDFACLETGNFDVAYL